MNIIKGDLSADFAKIAIVVSRFNQFISSNLLEGSVDILKRIGHVQDKNITVIWIPGSYELPLTIQALADLNKYDALIALGVIIRGLTAHFEFITRACSVELSNISMRHKLPVGFGVLTSDDINQAIARAGIKNNNKGAEAALAVLEMINILKIIN